MVRKMSIKDNVTGLLLDINEERTAHVDLPLIERTRIYRYDSENMNTVTDKYGEIVFFGDWHLGNEAHAINPFNAYLKLILDNPHLRVILTGDYFEYSSKTQHISDEIMDIDDQLDLFVKILRKIKDQVIAILPGNHDDRLAKYTGRRRYLQALAEQAGIDVDETYVGLPQRGVSVFIKAGSMNYSAYGTHGSTGAWRNKNTQLKRMAVSRRHTLLFMGHVHQVLWEPELYIEPSVDGSNLVRLQYWLATGGFLKDASYAEAKSYPVSLVGAPIVRFFATKNDLDMWQLPYRSQYLQGGVVPLEGIEGVRKWDHLGDPYRVRKQCLL